MKKRLVFGLLGIALVLTLAGNAWSDEYANPYTIMHPDEETRIRWIESFERAPKAFIDRNLAARTAP